MTAPATMQSEAMRRRSGADDRDPTAYDRDPTA